MIIPRQALKAVDRDRVLKMHKDEGIGMAAIAEQLGVWTGDICRVVRDDVIKRRRQGQQTARADWYQYESNNAN